MSSIYKKLRKNFGDTHNIHNSPLSIISNAVIFLSIFLLFSLCLFFYLRLFRQMKVKFASLTASFAKQNVATKTFIKGFCRDIHSSLNSKLAFFHWRRLFCYNFVCSTNFCYTYFRFLYLGSIFIYPV